MTIKLISPFAQPFPGLPIRKGAPALSRPSKEEIENFPAEAEKVLDSNWATQKPHIEASSYHLKRYYLDWLEGRHILLAGATGPGLGCALATPILKLNSVASLTIISRDLKHSLNFETGRLMQASAEAASWGDRFQWLNEGLALEGRALEICLEALKKAGADRVIYFNTVAAAISGLLPGMPPVFVKDVDEEGLFQWELTPLSKKEIQITQSVMGEMTVQFPKVLEENGITVEASIYADWRGSLDKASRDPNLREYGRQSSYSTSLFLPKDILHAETRAAYGTDRIVMDIFYPMMRTRALPFIPGAVTMADIQDKLKSKEGVRHVDIPELALGALDRVGKALTEGYDNPFPRLDTHDAHLDEWMFEIVERLTDDENSDFYYKKWLA